VALELDLPTIDVNTALTDYSEYFGDGIHPNNQGSSIITETIYKAISFSG
jgi:lysophospholipase L1-like esterase